MLIIMDIVFRVSLRELKIYFFFLDYIRIRIFAPLLEER